jgi:hypothetical protein
MKFSKSNFFVPNFSILISEVESESLTTLWKTIFKREASRAAGKVLAELIEELDHEDLEVTLTFSEILSGLSHPEPSGWLLESEVNRSAASAASATTQTARSC